MCTTADNSIEQSLGVLCQCAEYQKVINNFKCYTIGTRHYLLPTVSIKPVAEATVVWKRNQLTGKDISRPIIDCHREEPNINADLVDKIWIPLLLNNIPLKFIKPLKF